MPNKQDAEMLALIKESAMETLEPFVAACQERISGLERELLAARQEIATHKRMLKDICEEWNEDCDPQCDSIGHTETCKAVSIAQAKRAMREEIAALREAGLRMLQVINRSKKEAATVKEWDDARQALDRAIKGK